MTKQIRNICISGIFLALAIILPVYFHSFGNEFASKLSPMHFPVLALGLILGPIYGGVVGFMAPFLAFLINGRPMIYPMGISMALECLVYGLLSGLIYKYFKVIKNNTIRLYVALIASIIIGRIFYGIVSAFFTFVFNANSFVGFKEWAISIFVTGIIGIIAQIIIIPAIVIAIEKLNDNKTE